MPQLGDVVAGKYRLERIAGEGGMGVVYAAEHLVLRQTVAVKVLLPSAATSEAIVERFTREARAAARIVSEHVARVLDAGSLPSGAPFMVMEYLQGCDLEELLQSQRTLPVAEAVTYLIEALEGLAHAHAARLVHRDLKPSNLFLASRQDGTTTIKLLDFGISKATDGKPEDKRLTGHSVLGSPVYMSPEQLRNATEIDGRADLWSIGVVGYEMLCGQPPFDGAGVGEIFAAILEKSAVPPSERNARVPEGLSRVILKCLQREPHERWSNAGQLARALMPYGDGTAPAMVERAEQVLHRGRRLGFAETPIETRRVVEAIEAAEAVAKRAISVRPPAPARPTPRRATFDGVTTQARTFSQREPLGLGTAIGLGFLLAAAAATEVLRPQIQATARPWAAVASRIEAPPPAVEPEPEPAPAPAESAAPAESPVLMDLPSDARSAASPGRPAPSARPHRPKFLNSRE